MLNEKALFPVILNLQSHWLIKKMWWHNDRARRKQNVNENFVQVEMVISIPTGWKEWSFSKSCCLFQKISV